ncbi:MAG: SCO family protein [Sphingobacteriaceae bacterium]|nr:SCO family protein [Sphingobacteriaceae bacterium]
MRFPKFTLKKILILVTILAFPGLLYWMLTVKGKNRYKSLPFFGSKQVASTFHTKRGVKIPDTLYHTVRDFTLLNQDSAVFNFPAKTHRIFVVNFFYTRCTVFCANMNQQVNYFAKKYQRNSLLEFVSISVDGGHDSPTSLRGYQQNTGFQSANWTFLTGPQPEVAELAKQSFLVDVLPDPAQPTTIIHSSMLVLLDPQKRIRGYYDSLSKEQMEKLDDELKVLINEELRTRTDR